MPDKFHKELMEMYGNHQRLWNWLANERGRPEKCDWPEWNWKTGKIPYMLNHCFACQWARNARHSMTGRYAGVPKICSYCPIVWPTKNGRCEGRGDSPWDSWRMGGHDSEFARQIANLPLRPELIEESNE